MQHPRKLYFDSRFRSSGTHSDFEYTLAQGFEVADSTVCIIDTFACANEFAAIDSISTKNHRLFFSEKWYNGSQLEIAHRTVSLVDGHYNAYSLCSAIETALHSEAHSTFTVTYSELTSKFSFESSNNFKIWSREMLQHGDAETHVHWPGYDNDDIGEVLGNVSGQNPWSTSFEAPEIGDLAPVKQVFLCSNLGNGISSMGPRGESDIIRRIDVGAPYGSYFVDRISTPGEYIDCGGQQLSTLRFVLKDARGNILKLTKSVSFSLIFMDRHMLNV